MVHNIEGKIYFYPVEFEQALTRNHPHLNRP